MIAIQCTTYCFLRLRIMELWVRNKSQNARKWVNVNSCYFINLLYDQKIEQNRVCFRSNNIGDKIRINEKRWKGGKSRGKSFGAVASARILQGCFLLYIFGVSQDSRDSDNSSLLASRARLSQAAVQSMHVCKPVIRDPSYLLNSLPEPARLPDFSSLCTALVISSFIMPLPFLLSRLQILRKFSCLHIRAVPPPLRCPNFQRISYEDKERARDIIVLLECNCLARPSNRFTFN